MSTTTHIGQQPPSQPVRRSGGIFLKRMFSVVLPIIFAIGLFWYVYRNFSINELKASLAATNYWLLAGSLIPLTFSHYLRALRWRQMLEPLGYRPPIVKLFAAVMSGYVANLILPRAGEVLRCTILQKSANVPTEISLGNVLAERVLDLLMLGAITLLALFFEHERLSDFLGSLLLSKVANATLSTPLVIGLVVGGLAVAGLLYGLLYTFRKHRIVVAIYGFVSRLLHGLLSVKDVQNLSGFVMNTCLIWAGYYFSSAMVLYGFSPTADLPIASALVLNVIGAFGMVAPVQGGIGAYHYMVSTGLTEIYAVLPNNSLSLAFLLHTSQLIYNIVIGGACFFWLSQQRATPIVKSAPTTTF